MEIGEILKKRRLELNLTLEDVGKKVGVSKSTVKKWEDGYIANMKRDKIASLAKALQLKPSIIMGWEGHDNFDFSPAYNKEPNKIEHFTVYAMDGTPGAQGIDINMDTLPMLDELLKVARDLPKDKIETLIATAKAMK